MTPTMRGRRRSRTQRRALVLAAVLAVTGCALPWDEGRATAEIQGYRLGPIPTHITVVYGTGPGDGAGGAEVLEQSTTRVKVRVTYERSTEPQDSILVGRDVMVPLDAPLGDRAVVDEVGRDVPRR
jgi:hypothetical protein